MTNTSKIENTAESSRVFWAVFALVTAWKVYASWALTLCYDEPYYHYWSLHPQLSYFDHPPMVAWLMTLSRFVFGDSVWSVRIWPVLLSGVAVLFGRATAIRMFDESAGNRAGILLALAPIFMGNGIVMTPDAPLVAFWAIAFYCAWRALESEKVMTLWWVALGVSAGCGFLSKYNMVLFYFGLILLFIISPKDRKRIFLGCVISGAVAALVFSPVIVWNVVNDFASFRFQFSHRLAQVPKSKLNNVIEYAGILLALVTPVLGGLCFFNCAQRIFSAELRVKYCAVFFWSVVAMFAYSAFKVRIQANWPMMAFFSALILVAWRLPGHTLWLRRAAWGVLIAADVALCGYLMIPTQTPLSVGGHSLDVPRIREFLITPQMAVAVNTKLAETQLDFIVTSSHELFGIIQFYAPELREKLWLRTATKIRFPWLDGSKFVGKSALLVSDRKDWGPALIFEKVEPIGSVDIPYKGVKLTLFFFKGTGFKLEETAATPNMKN